MYKRQIYKKVIERERCGDYLGKTVQIIPHVTDEIMDRVESVARAPVDGSGAPPDICIVELGGTIGDIESMPFVEALRQLQLRHGPSGFCLVHVSMVPTTGPPPGEQKTKPTQHSVKELRSLGLTPDFIVCRSAHEVGLATRDKIGLFCNVPTERVLSLYDVPNIYRVPLEMLDRSVEEDWLYRLKVFGASFYATEMLIEELNLAKEDTIMLEPRMVL